MVRTRPAARGAAASLAPLRNRPPVLCFQMSWRGCFRLDQKWVGAVGARVEVVLWCVVMFAASVQRDPTLHLRPGPPSGCAKLADCAQGSPGLCVYRTVRRAPLRRAFVAQSPYSIPPAMDISHGPQRARTRTQFRVVLRRQCIHIPHVTCARRGCPQHPSCVGVTPEPAISSRATRTLEAGGPGRASSTGRYKTVARPACRLSICRAPPLASQLAHSWSARGHRRRPEPRRGQRQSKRWSNPASWSVSVS